MQCTMPMHINPVMPLQHMQQPHVHGNAIPNWAEYNTMSYNNEGQMFIVNVATLHNQTHVAWAG